MSGMGEHFTAFRVLSVKSGYSASNFTGASGIFFYLERLHFPAPKIFCTPICFVMAISIDVMPEKGCSNTERYAGPIEASP